jgi:hypothetical protein
MLKEPRLAKLVGKEDAEVKSGEKKVEDELAEIRKSLEPLYKTIVHAFEYYCLVANNFTRTAFEMGENSYNRFVTDCKLVDKKFSTETAQQIFVAVNVESDKKSAESTINEDKCLMRMEFVEVIIRAAIVKYKEEANHDISDAVAMLVERNLKPNIPPQGQVNCDDFRVNRLYCREVDEVLVKHHGVLKLVGVRGGGVVGLGERSSMRASEAACERAKQHASERSSMRASEASTEERGRWCCRS